MPADKVSAAPTRPSPQTPAPTKASTILSHRHYRKVCAASVLVYLTIHIAWGINNLLSAAPLCPLKVHPTGWARDVSLVVCGTFIAGIGLQINRISLSTFREETDIGTLSSYYASLCVNIIAATSHISTLVAQWGGTCVDAFGVQTAAGRWPERLISVPLLAFIVLSVDDKPILSTEDLCVIASLFFYVLFGFLLQTTTDIALSYVYLFLSVCCCWPCVWIVIQTNRELSSLLQQPTHHHGRKGIYQRKVLLASRKGTLAFGLGLLLPMFSVIYILAISGAISAEVSYVAFDTYNAFTKLLFSLLCMDAHLEISHPAIGLIDAENFSNTSRRAFLRYVLHEVRVPLNSISLGIQILSDSERIDGIEKDTLTMMRDASSFMGEVLNDVMALQRIEEGSLELIKKSFSIEELFQTIEDSFLDMCREQEVDLHVEIDRNLPMRLIGDKFRIGHVLANLVSNAIKFSYEKSVVVLKASEATDAPVGYDLDEISQQCVLVKFTICDEGRGISEEDQAEDIFQPFRNLKHGELQKNRGTGLGLAISREIVHMHGGRIEYTSKPGKGSTFHVILPLEIYTGPITPAWKRARRQPRRKQVIEPSAHLEILDDAYQNELGRSMSSSTNRSMQRLSSRYIPTSASNTTLSGIALESPCDSDVEPFDSDRHLGSSVERDGSSTATSRTTEVTFRADSPVGLAPESRMSSMSSGRMRGALAKNNSRRLAMPALMVEDESRLGMSNSTPLLMNKMERQKSKDGSEDGGGIRPSTTTATGTSRFAFINALIVDDVLSNRKLLALLLNKRGLKSVTFAEDGQAAIEAVESAGVDFFDIIFMDNTMPVMTGIQATSQLRRIGFKKLIIGVTGNSMEDEIQDFVQCGADLVITKPMKSNMLEQLLTMVEQSGCLSHPDKRLYLIENAVVWINRRIPRSHSMGSVKVE